MDDEKDFTISEGGVIDTEINVCLTCGETFIGPNRGKHLRKKGWICKSCMNIIYPKKSPEKEYDCVEAIESIDSGDQERIEDVNALLFPDSNCLTEGLFGLE